MKIEALAVGITVGLGEVPGRYRPVTRDNEIIIMVMMLMMMMMIIIIIVLQFQT